MIMREVTRPTKYFYALRDRLLGLFHSLPRRPCWERDEIFFIFRSEQKLFYINCVKNIHKIKKRRNIIIVHNLRIMSYYYYLSTRFLLSWYMVPRVLQS